MKTNGPIGRNTYLALTAALLIIGFSATTLTSYFVSITTIRDTIFEQELPLTSDNVYSEIQKDLVRPVFVSSMMATDTFLRDWVLDGEKDPGPMVKYLDDVMARYNAVTSFFVSEQTRDYYHPNGIVQRVDEDDPEDTWYFRVREMEDVYEINVDFDQANDNALTIFINYRVFDYEGNFIGVTGIGLKVESVKKVITGYQSRYERNVYFLDQGGAVTLKAEDGIGSLDGLATIRDDIITVDQGAFEYNADGENYLVTTRFIPELSWFLVVEQREGALTEDIRRTLVFNLIICAVISVVILTIFTFVTRNYQSRLITMATTDKLTGLLNRQAFDVMIEQAIAESRRDGNALSVILFDIDDFKAINDKFGHLTGDKVIQDITRQCSGLIREADSLCRWGGEEFLVLLRHCTQEQAYEIAEKIRHDIQAVRHTEEAWTVTLSLGVASYSAGDNREGLIGRADKALYKAKHSGKNRTETI